VARKPKPWKTRPARREVGLRVRGRVYRAILTPDLKVGGYTVRVPRLSGCVTEGDTLAEEKRMTREAFETWLPVGLLPSQRPCDPSIVRHELDVSASIPPLHGVDADAAGTWCPGALERCPGGAISMSGTPCAESTQRARLLAK
jgi:predicted RNase H-like HicB family nuclease